MAHRITLIPGDGVGPEVIEAARRAIEATGVAVEWDRQQIGSGAFARTGKSLPADTLASIRANRVALKGPIETPITSGLRSVNLTLRQELDLYANVRPCRLYPGVPSVYDTVDLIVKAASRRRFLRPEGEQMPSLNLTEARRVHGLPSYAAHDALIDAVATAELFLVLRQVIGAKTLRDLR